MPSVENRELFEGFYGPKPQLFNGSFDDRKRVFEIYNMDPSTKYALLIESEVTRRKNVKYDAQTEYAVSPKTLDPDRMVRRTILFDRNWKSRTNVILSSLGISHFVESGFVNWQVKTTPRISSNKGIPSDISVGINDGEFNSLQLGFGSYLNNTGPIIRPTIIAFSEGGVDRVRNQIISARQKWDSPSPVENIPLGIMLTELPDGTFSVHSSPRKLRQQGMTLKKALIPGELYEDPKLKCSIKLTNLADSRVIERYNSKGETLVFALPVFERRKFLYLAQNTWDKFVQFPEVFPVQFSDSSQDRVAA